MRPYVEALATCSDTYVHCYLNAGLPDEFGEYDDTPEHLAKVLSTFAESGWLNLVGGCCGTTPDHIRAIWEAMQGTAMSGGARETDTIQWVGAVRDYGGHEFRDGRRANERDGLPALRTFD